MQKKTTNENKAAAAFCYSKGGPVTLQISGKIETFHAVQELLRACQDPNKNRRNAVIHGIDVYNREHRPQGSTQRPRFANNFAW